MMERPFYPDPRSVLCLENGEAGDRASFQPVPVDSSVYTRRAHMMCFLRGETHCNPAVAGGAHGPLQLQ